METVRYCACGCGSVLMSNDPSRIYKRGHKPKFKAKKCLSENCNNSVIGKSKYCKMCLDKMKPLPRLCACGCGGIVTSSLREVRFLPGHNATTKECKDKARKTCLERYGSSNPIGNKEIQEKSKNTCIEKYGKDNVFKVDLIKEKIRNHYQNLYNGATNPSQVEEIHRKQTDSIIETRRLNTYSKLTTAYNFVELISSYQDFLNYENGNLDLLKWRCHKCGTEFYSRRDSNWRGECRCYICFPYIPSKYQKQIFEFVSELDKTATQNRRDIILHKELDIYITSKKLAIEFDGLFWHSHQQICDKNYHLSKTELCEEIGIQLVHIFEDEWLYKEAIVKSRLKNLLGIYDKTIYARKCNVVQIDKKICDDFLNQNHIQGSCNSKYNYGLYYNNELVALMTFGSYRKALGREKVSNEYELLRFCCKLGYHIPGAASRLFKHFIKDYNPIKIISYADRRWSLGNLYNSLNFKFLYNTPPNYWYVIDCHREHRFAWRKSILQIKLKQFDINLSEYDNMIRNGYDCIYDCGSKLYEWTV